MVTDRPTGADSKLGHFRPTTVEELAFGEDRLRRNQTVGDDLLVL